MADQIAQSGEGQLRLDAKTLLGRLAKLLFDGLILACIAAALSGVQMSTGKRKPSSRNRATWSSVSNVGMAISTVRR